MSQTKIDDYEAKYISNRKVEYLMEYGKKYQTVFFKGETGDRYSIYVFTKRNKNTIDIHQVYNTYSHDTESGSYVGTINKDYIMQIVNNGSHYWRCGTGDLIRQLDRQGICPRGDKAYKVRYCRKAYFMRTHDGNEFSPWKGIKIDLKTGLLANKPTKMAKEMYKDAKEVDRIQRKRNYTANKENTKALERYRKAGGDTSFRDSIWRDGKRIDLIDETLKTIDWSLIPMDDVFRHRNATLRSNIIEHYGMNAILAKLDHVVVDEETIDGRPYKLLDVTIPDFSDNTPGFDGSYKGLYLEMINPSTGESHFEGIPNANNSNWGIGLKEATVKAALTWRDNDIAVQLGHTDSWRSTNAKGESDDYIQPVVLK